MMNKDEFLNELEGFLLEDEAKDLEIMITGEEEQDAPAIDSPQKANYFLKLVKSIDEDITSVNSLCDEEIAKTKERIDRYREAQLKPLINHKEYLLKLLRNYTEHVIADSKKRSIKLPNGTLGMTKQQPVWTYNDEDIIAFLKENNVDDLYTVEVKEKLDKTAFKKIVTIEDQGNITLKGITVPGVEVTPREDKFTVK